MFSEDYARDNFGKDWQTSRVYGTIRQAAGKHLWQVDFQDGTNFTLKSRQLRQEKELPDGIAEIHDDSNDDEASEYSLGLTSASETELPADMALPESDDELPEIESNDDSAFAHLCSVRG